MTQYFVKTTFGSFRFQADFVQAACIICSLPDSDDDESEGSPTPYQVADARHIPEIAARLLLEYYGRAYWCDEDCVDEDEEGNETFNGMSKNDYLRSLIVSVETEV